MFKHTLTLVVAALLAGFSASALAQWQWVDGDGRKVFSDRPPPPSIPQDRILKAPRGAAAAAPTITYGPPAEEPAKEAAPAKPALTPEQAQQAAEHEKAEAERKAAEEADAAKRAEIEKKNAEVEKNNALARANNCANARARLTQLEAGRRVSTVNADGKAGFMDDATRAAERQRAEASVRSNC